MNYILIIVWLAFFYLIRDEDSNYYEMLNPCGKIGYYNYRYTSKAAFLLVTPLIIWAGCRESVGDTFLYKANFLKMPSDFYQIGVYMQTVDSDKGFYFLSSVIKCFIGENTEIYFLIIAFIQMGCVLYFFKDYSSDYLVSIFIFVTSASYFAWMQNGIRQFLAVCITLVSFRFIIQKKYFKALLIAAIAITIHASSIIFIPFVLICKGKAWNKRTVVFVLVSLLLLGTTGGLNSLLKTVTENTQYGGSVDSWMDLGDDGTNPLRVLVHSIPALLSLYGLNRIRAEEDELIDWLTNFSIVTMGLYLLSMVTSGIYMGRVPIYFSLYSFALLPWLIKNLFTEDVSKIINYVMIGCFLFFYWYSIG